ncbi:MAG: imidazole glycerol phosphate synthase cyclase subunit [Alphaproteobacteria bacterium]|nr:imidazole glycerol phosphate synthase cyclase subunit [Alphaproteobacteria bacterium]
MLKKRLIPVLLLSQGRLAKTTRFSNLQLIGYPTYQVERYNEWSVDELIYLDISREAVYDGQREDLRVANLRSVAEIVTAVSQNCFMPLTFGGRLRSLEDMREMLAAGADRVTINTAAVRRPTLVGEAAAEFGNQCVVVVIDVRQTDSGPRVFTDCGREDTAMHPVDWAREVEALGAGEIVLQSIDRDGTYRGYDLGVLAEVCAAVTIPVISVGGAREPRHFIEGIEAGASGVAAANVFHLRENADRQIRRAMLAANVPLRRI